MAADAPAFAIVINRATAQQRAQVHEIVKSNADGWWHGFGDLWIVRGKSVEGWRDLVGIAFSAVPSGVIVLRIADPGVPRWAYRAKLSDSAADWLRKEL